MQKREYAVHFLCFSELQVGYRILQLLVRYWTPYGTEQCRITLLKWDYALDSCGLNPAEIMSCCLHC